MPDRILDIAIIGSGIVGAAAACLLARAGFSVAVIEAGEAPEFNPENPVGLRVSAISPGSRAVLIEAGAWRRVSENRHCDYRRMRVEDRADGAVLEFNAAEFGLERLGTIVENDLLQDALWKCMRSLAGIELINPARVAEFDFDQPSLRLEDGREIRARVLVGADGADSAVRKAMGIGQQYWDYGQRGIVAVVRTEHPNTGVAWQRFLSGGPLAFLPLQDGSSSIVWSVPEAEAQRLLGLEAAEFCAELPTAANTPFGSVLSSGPRAAFPLRMQLSDAYAAGQAVLAGDAAHVVHPLAGQGANLGLGDAAALLETLLEARKAGKDFYGEKVLLHYARWRRSEAEVMARGVHGLRSIFTPDLLTPLRRLGLGVVSRSWALKEAFIRRAVGHNRNAPALTRGLALSDLVAGR